jgi:hypothetical protein
MTDLTRTTRQTEPEEFHTATAAQEWVKPTLERLSLKQALSGTGCTPEGCTFGS